MKKRRDPAVTQPTGRPGAARRWARRLLCGLLAAAVLLGAALTGLVAVGRARLAARGGVVPDLTDGTGWVWQDETTLLADGVAYAPRRGLFTLLCIGLGSSAQREQDGQVLGMGVADTLVLVCFDLETGELTLLCIPRDTQTGIVWCDSAGNALFTRQGHLALQYGYGGGTHALCSQNMADAVERLLCGAGVESWFTVDMDAIVTLVDALGGVAVTVPDDPYYCAYTGYQPGQWVRLDGAAALQFVQYRDVTVFASCEMRIERQKAFLSNLLDLLRQTVCKAPWRLPGLYAAMQGQYHTDLTLPEIAALAAAALRVEIDGIAMQTLPGEVRTGILYEEYHLDEAAVRQLLLEIFYQSVG